MVLTVQTKEFLQPSCVLEHFRFIGALPTSHHLSVGEKKRIAIATVLSMNPQILVLDEPSAGLDPRARRTLINLLRDLPITTLVFAHDMKLDEGLIVTDGDTRRYFKMRNSVLV